MATHRRSYRDHLSARPGRALLAAGLIAGALYSGGPAGAAPAPAPAPPPAPASASDAVQQMIDLSRQAEQLNQQALTAQTDLDAKLAVQRDADGKVAAATATVDAAHAEVDKYRPMIDRTAIAAYQGARTNRLFAVLVSDSPQQLLDQMSTLDVVATQTSDQLRKYKRATDAATDAQTAARGAADAARAATDQANRVRDDVARKQTDLQNAVARVIEVWGTLSTADRTALAGSPFPPGFDRDTLLQDLVPGSGTSALAAGLTRVGDPYVWGATGPDQFDCSGLVQWAFAQVGKEVPRTSSAQAAYGTPVDRADLQPGDVVFFYPDITHVGIYAGNGLMLHASTFGVPVAVAPVDSTPYHSARRY